MGMVEELEDKEVNQLGLAYRLGSQGNDQLLS